MDLLEHLESFGTNIYDERTYYMPVICGKKQRNKDIMNLTGFFQPPRLFFLLSLRCWVAIYLSSIQGTLGIFLGANFGADVQGLFLGGVFSLPFQNVGSISLLFKNNGVEKEGFPIYIMLP